MEVAVVVTAVVAPAAVAAAPVDGDDGDAARKKPVLQSVQSSFGMSHFCTGN